MLNPVKASAEISPAQQAELYAAQGKIAEAITAYMEAIRANPANIHYKQRFIEIAGGAIVTRYDERNESVLMDCLTSADQLDLLDLQVFWSGHIIHHPAFQAYDLLARTWFDPANEDFFNNLTDLKPLLTPVFLLGVKYLVVQNPLFEEFITHIRKHLLEDLDVHKKLTNAESLTLAVALSHYSFYTDYILDTTAAEQKKVDALRIKIEAGEKDAVSVAVFACYEPLYTLKNARELSSLPGMADVIKTQITDYETLRKTAADIVAITPIDDFTSTKVQEQYEAFPYPRWKCFSAEATLRNWESFPDSVQIETPLRGRKTKILIAGCGTGSQVVAIAAIFPDADILAVDLSRTSLAYAIIKAEEYNVKNVTFRQADILRLGDLGQTFDYIVTTGVLHHMKDPVQGWRVLRDLLKPGGLMKLALYSKIARRNMLTAHGVIKRGGYTSDSRSMKAFRKNSPQILGVELLEKITRYKDYYYLSMYRDLLFHAQEYNYDLIEIRDILKELNMTFSRVPVYPWISSSYDALYPNDPERVDLRNWHHLEERTPDLFKYMYIFWCRREG